MSRVATGSKIPIAAIRAIQASAEHHDILAERYGVNRRTIYRYQKESMRDAADIRDRENAEHQRRREEKRRLHTKAEKDLRNRLRQEIATINWR